MNEPRDVLHRTPVRSLGLALLLLVLAGIVVHDLRRSVTEHRAVEDWSVCSDPRPDCLVGQQVTLSGPDGYRGTGINAWTASPEDGGSTRFDLQPAYTDLALTLDDGGVVHRFDGDVVAISDPDSGDRAPTAFSGLHAMTLDGFGLLALLGGTSVGVGSARRGLRAGVGWRGAIPRKERRRRAPDALVGILGVVGLAATFNLALSGTRAWAVTLGLCAAAALVQGSYLLARRVNGSGRHAA